MSQDDRLKFYGRRKGRPLLKARQELVDALLPEVKIQVGEEIIDPQTLFPNDPKDLWFEIGFGGGEHLAYQAENNNDVGIIGAEAFINGVSSLLRYIHEKDLTNVRIYDEDVRLLFPKLKQNSFDRIFVLFPDPWTKKRHFKRRLINEETLGIFNSLLKEGGLLRIASDEPSYQEWIIEHLEKSPHFEMPEGSIKDWEMPPQDWTQTRYEKKARREGRTPLFMDFRKKT